MKTLYWHDYETWGSSPAKDKPSQFAGIRTDEMLNVVGEPLVMYCQPPTDCLPHPEACLLTGITPQKALADGVSDIDFFRRIHQQLAEPGTCGVGYNSIRFDDEVTRYGLYRNFYDPYAREWQHGNSRWDTIDMVRLCYALRPEGLQWPLNEQGEPVFRLEKLSEANGLLHDSAHDALSDVYATIALARLIRQHHPELYAYAYSLRDKRRVAAMVDLEQHKPLLHVSSRFPAAQGCAALVVPLVEHPENKNSVICFDLSTDPQPLLQLSADEISERVFVKQKDLPEGCVRIPLKVIHLNKSPIIATPKLLDSAAADRLGIDKAVCEMHWHQLLRGRRQWRNTVQDVFRQHRFPASSDAEQQLYESFISDHDKKHFEAIRHVEPKALAAYSRQLRDPRLQVLLFRYRARHYPHTLTPQEAEQWRQWRHDQLTGEHSTASIVLEDYFERLSAYSAEPNVRQDIVQALLEYGDGLLSD